MTIPSPLPRPRRALWKLLLLSAFAGGAAGLGFTWCLCRLEEQGNGGSSVFMLEMGMSLLWLCVVVVGLPSLLLPKFRRAGLATLAACAALYAARDQTHHWPREVRLRAFERLAVRSQGLVDAIHAYEQEYSATPPDLTALVPEFLSEIPGTGMPSCPNYEYAVMTDDLDPERRWDLKVSCPAGLINWDEFIYCPEESRFDPDVDPVTRLGDWFYYHE